MNNDRPPNEIAENSSDKPALPSGQFTSPGAVKDEYTDGRKTWDWKSKYPPEARSSINREACFLSLSLTIFLGLTGLFLSLAGQSLQIPIPWLAALSSGTAPALVSANQRLTLSIDCHLLAVFFAGSVGGTTFSIKWLVHAVAKGRWHLDRRYWRLFVPFIGGVYACVVLTLFDAGVVGGNRALAEPRPIAIAAAFAFLVGYFSDGVSGLLSNIANAVFGTLEKK